VHSHMERSLEELQAMCYRPKEEERQLMAMTPTKDGLRYQQTCQDPSCSEKATRFLRQPDGTLLSSCKRHVKRT